MIRLTRRYKFSAAHRLHCAQLSEAENRGIYGKCNNPHGHGHDYVLEVSLAGPVDESSGRVADVRKLDRLVEEQVLRAFDHHDLNADVPEFAATPPTTENLALEIRRRLQANWRAAFPDRAPVLHRVRLHETRRNMVELLS